MKRLAVVGDLLFSSFPKSGDDLFHKEQNGASPAHILRPWISLLQPKISEGFGWGIISEFYVE